jgi:predicted transcriptional regulator
LHFTGKQILALFHISTRPVTPVVFTCNWDYQWLIFILDCLSVNGNCATGMRVEA